MIKTDSFAKKILITSLLLLAAVYGTASAEDTENNEYKHHLGVAASSLSGVGISYGCSFHPDYMFRICGIYTETNDKVSGTSEYTKDIWWNTGGEIQRFLFIIPSGNMAFTGYGLAGGNYWYSKYEDPSDPGDNSLERRWTAGIAMGLRVVFFERIAVNVEFGYQYGRDITDDTRNTGIAAGAGAHFVF